MKIKKVMSLFTGIGSFEKALSNLGIVYDLVGFSEIDKWAAKSYCAVHGVDEDLNLGDITKVNEKELPDFDTLFYGFPCQSYSLAGKKLGMDDPRGVLFYDALRVIREKKPKYAIAENVKNLTGNKFKPIFKDMLSELDYAGYNNYWKVLNTRHFGVPQNRERVFIISIRKDIDDGSFEFPEGSDMSGQIKDILEDNVGESFYINDDERLEKINNTMQFGRNYLQYDLSGKGHKSQDQRAYYQDGYHGTLPSHGGSSKCKVLLGADVQTRRVDECDNQFTTKNSIVNGETPRDTVEKKNANGDWEVVVRSLTPKECWRLQGFDDKDVDKSIAAGVSNAQLYKQAGNSITVDVLEEIFKKLKSR